MVEEYEPLVIQVEDVCRALPNLAEAELEIEFAKKIKIINEGVAKLWNPYLFIMKLIQMDLFNSKSKFGNNETVENKVIYEEQKSKSFLEAVFHAEKIPNAKFKITKELCNDVHRILGSNPHRLNKSTTPGMIRKGKVHIGSKDDQYSIRVVPLMPDEVHKIWPKVLSELQKTFADRPFLAASRFYYTTIAVHPYGDCNGRLARTLSAIAIYKALGCDWPSIWISQSIEKHRRVQYEIFRESTETKNLQKWDEFFSDIITESFSLSESILSYLSKLQYIDEVRVEESATKMMYLKILLNQLYYNPKQKILDVSRAIGLSPIEIVRMAENQPGLSFDHQTDSVIHTELFRFIYNQTEFRG